MSEKTNGLEVARINTKEDKIIARYFYQLWLDKLKKLSPNKARSR